MSIAPQPPSDAVPEPLPAGVVVVRGSKELAHDVARRIVSQANPNLDEAASRLIANGAAHGVDFRFSWASVDRAGLGDSLRVRQACLMVPGAGRTGMVFLSEPMRTGEASGPGSARAERAAALRAMCAGIAGELGSRVVLVQSLPSMDERWAQEAFLDAGFQRVGTLLYMRRAPKAGDAKLSLGADLSTVAWPDGVRVCSVREWERERGPSDAALIEAMNASYVETLDCPELCGLRETRDILASHRATGICDPSMWWIVTHRGEPHGCALFSPCPDQRSFELVYLGLSPVLRGKGLGLKLLRHGIGVCAGVQGAWSMACAVDERNGPAVKLYESQQFRSFSRRCALVRRVGAGASG